MTTEDDELIAAAVRALPTAGTLAEHATAAVEAVKPLIEERVRREVGIEAVNTLRLKDQRIAELIQDREVLRGKLHSMWLYRPVPPGRDSYIEGIKDALALIRDDDV